MKIVDKRTAEGTVEIRTLPKGSLIEIDGGLRTSMKDEQRMAIVLERNSVDGHGGHSDQIPVALLAGEIGWLSKTVHDTPLEATIEVDHKRYEGEKGSPAREEGPR